VIAIVLLTGALTWVALRSGTHPSVGPAPGHPAITVRVLASQGSWQFDYEGGGTVAQSPGAAPEMVIPAGQTVLLVLRSQDIVHTFFIPALPFKADAIPGVTGHIDLNVRRPGLYRGQDGENNPSLDSSGPFTVRVMSPREFRRWVPGA